jgi:hypothetical protein
MAAIIAMTSGGCCGMAAPRNSSDPQPLRIQSAGISFASEKNSIERSRPVKHRSLFSLAFAAILLPMLLLSACWQRGCKTPADAKARLLAAVAARDPARLWGALDLDTQWSWMTIHRAGRESHDITLSNFPEGQQRERMIRRFAPAATSENAAQLFAKSLPADLWPNLAAQLAAAGDRTPVVNAAGSEAEIVWPTGRLLFRKTSKPAFGWGFAGLAAEAEALKRAASADLEALRTNAADYERAATRGLR